MANPRNYSPLRYPGGKACLTHFITDLAHRNNLNEGVYVELYAGGAGAALNMLFDNTFNRIHINDFDYNIYSIWYSILNHSEEFIRRIIDINVSIDEWHRQQAIYQLGRNAGILDLGIATFFLNRTNRSGIIYKAGPIGGQSQLGNYKIDARFNKETLKNRLEKIALYSNRIHLTNLDAVDVINNMQIYHRLDEVFLYLDPPYYKKGKFLYLNNYNFSDHQNLANAVANLADVRWLISYDNVKEIKDIYSNYRKTSFDLNYMLQSKKFGSELLIYSNNLEVNNEIFVNNRTNELALI